MVPLTAAEDGSPTCWWCSVEPVETFELHSLKGAVREIHQWPPGDHTHDVRPPTADEMLDQVLLKRGEEI